MAMSVTMLLILVLFVLLVATLPRWSHARTWGYGPSVALAVMIVVLLASLLSGAAQAGG